jgi:hypothetical protein
MQPGRRTPWPASAIASSRSTRCCRARRTADHMQAMRNQRVLELEHAARPAPARSASPRGRGPSRLGSGQVERRRPAPASERRASARSPAHRLQRAPALDRGLEVVQALVEAGLRDRWRQVADQRGAAAALGDGAFGGIVRGVEVEFGRSPIRRSGQQLPDRPLCLPGMNSSAPWVPKCSTACAEVLAQVAVEGREGMRRRKALFEQQAHRVAFVAERGLHSRRTRCRSARRARRSSCRRSAAWPGAGPHWASISFSQRSRRTWSSARCARARWRSRRSAAALP